MNKKPNASGATRPPTCCRSSRSSTAPSCPACLRRAIAAGASADVDLMVGSNAHEGRLFRTDGAVRRCRRSSCTSTHAQRAPRSRSDPSKAYRKSRSTESWGRYHRVLHDRRLLLALRYALAEAHPGTFVYEFQWKPRRFPWDHAMPLRCRSYSTDWDGSRYAALTGPSAPKRSAAAMHKAWIDFAVTGDPGWPRLRSHHSIDDGVQQDLRCRTRPASARQGGTKR